MSSVLPSLALLAGGFATRMRPLTETVPKSMLKVAGYPFIAHQLRLLASRGIRDVVLCCGFLGEQIAEFVGDGSVFGCNVRYSHDGTRLRGTGGAIQKAFPMLGDHFFVMYGDSYLPAEIQPVYDAFLKQSKLGMMTVFQNENCWDTSNVEFSGQTILNYDKKNPTPAMHYIDYGLGILEKAGFERWKNEEVFDLSDVYRDLMRVGQLAGYEVNERFYEIGTPAGLTETEALLSGSDSQPMLRGSGCKTLRRSE